MAVERSRFWAMLANTPRLLRLVWQAAPHWLLLTLILTLIAGLAPVAQLYVGKLIVDQVVQMVQQPGLNAQPLIELLSLGFGLFMVQSACTQGNLYVAQVLSDRFTLYANHVLLRQAIRLDLAHYELPEFYDTLYRAQQDGSSYPVRTLSTLNTLIGQTVSLAGLITLLLRFNPLVMVLLLVTSIPTFWVGIKFSGRRYWMVRRQTQSGRLADYLQRVMTEQAYAKEVRLFNLGHYLLNQWYTIRRQFNDESAALGKRHVSARVGLGIIAQMGFYGAYGVVLWQAVRGWVTIGDLTLYAGAFQQAQNALQVILQSVNNIYEYNLYVSQYFEFLSLKPQVIDRPSPRAFPTPMRSGLVLHNVTFTYPGATEPTLQNLNLTVHPGESIALVGANGAGKTTLLKVLARFYDIDAGEIAIDGIPLRELELSELRRNIGVIFQDFARYALSVEDNIGFGDIQQRHNFDRIQQAAIAAGATPVIDNLDNGYQTILGKIFTDGMELSGGQWQKIGLSRAFMTPAQILILDEPTAAVDAMTEYDLFQRFRQLTAGKMTFLVSHRFSTVRMADRIVVLENGQITEVGSHSELMARDQLYAKMFRLQAESYTDF